MVTLASRRAQSTGANREITLASQVLGTLLWSPLGSHDERSRRGTQPKCRDATLRARLRRRVLSSDNPLTEHASPPIRTSLQTRKPIANESPAPFDPAPFDPAGCSFCDTPGRGADSAGTTSQARLALARTGKPCRSASRCASGNRPADGGYAAAGAATGLVPRDRHREQGRGDAGGLRQVPDEDLRPARREEGREAHARGVPQGRRATLLDRRSRHCRHWPIARPAPGPNSTTSTPTATASSSAPRPRRSSTRSSTSTTPTATTR